jgi:Ca2+-binding RTX toxin-like protein
MATADTIVSSSYAGADRLDGNDYRDGGSLNERLEGGAGLDTMLGNGVDDRLFCHDHEAEQLFSEKDYDYAVIEGCDTDRHRKPGGSGHLAVPRWRKPSWPRRGAVLLRRNLFYAIPQ